MYSAHQKKGRHILCHDAGMMPGYAVVVAIWFWLTRSRPPCERKKYLIGRYSILSDLESKLNTGRPTGTSMGHSMAPFQHLTPQFFCYSSWKYLSKDAVSLL
jgi:hypothetical protein